MDYCLEVLMRVVTRADRSEFAIFCPTLEEIKSYASLLEKKRVNGALLSGEFAIADGVRMNCADYSDLYLQKRLL